MFFTRFACVTCAFYLGVAFLADVVITCLGRWKNYSFFWAKESSPLPIGVVFFGGIWLVAFLISWRIVVTPLLVRMFTQINRI